MLATWRRAQVAAFPVADDIATLKARRADAINVDFMMFSNSKRLTSG